MAEDKVRDVTLKDVILKFKEWLAFLKKKWVILLITGIVGCGLGLLYAFIAKPKYTADLTFVLTTNNKVSGLAGLVGQLGIDLNSNNSDDLFSGDNIIELFKSRKIIKAALFRKVPGSSQNLINLILVKSKILEVWQKQSRLQGLVPFPEDINKLTAIQDSLVGEIHELIIKRYITVGKIDKKLSFYKFSTTSVDEIISCYLSKYIVGEASAFYIQTKTKTAKQNLQMLQHEADSLRNLLGGAIITTGAETDRTFNLNPAYQVQRSNAQQGQLNATVLGTAYGEVVKNLELAKIALQRETPMYQLVDEPSLPLKQVKAGKIKWFIIGGFVSTFFMSVFLIVKYLYRQILSL